MIKVEVMQKNGSKALKNGVNKKKIRNKVALAATSVVAITSVIPMIDGFESLINKNDGELSSNKLQQEINEVNSNAQLKADADKIDDILASKLFNKVNTNNYKIIAYGSFLNANSYSRKAASPESIKNGSANLLPPRILINNKFSRLPDNVKIGYKVIKHTSDKKSFSHVKYSFTPPTNLKNGDKIQISLYPTGTAKELTNQQTVFLVVKDLLLEGPENLKYEFKYDNKDKGVISGEGTGSIVVKDQAILKNYKWVYATEYGYFGEKDIDTIPKNSDYSIKKPANLKNNAAVFYKLVTKDNKQVYNNYANVVVINDLKKVLHVDKNILTKIDVTFYGKKNALKITELTENDSKLNLISKAFPSETKISYWKNNKEINLSLLTNFKYKDTFQIKVEPTENVILNKDFKEQVLTIKYIAKPPSKNIFVNNLLVKKIKQFFDK